MLYETTESLKHAASETSVELFRVVPSNTGDYDGDDFEFKPYIREPIKDEIPKGKTGLFRKMY